MHFASAAQRVKGWLRVSSRTFEKVLLAA